jgi:hypothetical protein
MHLTNPRSIQLEVNNENSTESIMAATLTYLSQNTVKMINACTGNRGHMFAALRMSGFIRQRCFGVNFSNCR